MNEKKQKNIMKYDMNMNIYRTYEKEVYPSYVMVSRTCIFLKFNIIWTQQNVYFP